MEGNGADTTVKQSSIHFNVNNSLNLLEIPDETLLKDFATKGEMTSTSESHHAPVNESIVNEKHRELLMEHAMTILLEQPLADKKSKELNNILAEYLINKGVNIQGKKNDGANEKYHRMLEEFYKTHKQSVLTEKAIHARLAEANERRTKIDDELSRVKKGKRTITTLNISTSNCLT